MAAGTMARPTETLWFERSAVHRPFPYPEYRWARQERSIQGAVLAAGVDTWTISMGPGRLLSAVCQAVQANRSG